MAPLADSGVADRRPRCPWGRSGDRALEEYHDREWGVPTHSDPRHFEFLLLEAAQAGLSWTTILRKRAGYASAFAGFDAARVARFRAATLGRLREDPGIVRNGRKIESAVTNARAFLRIQKELGSFDRYVWPFVGGRAKQNGWASVREVPPTSPEAGALSRDLQRRGFRFVGPTIVYAYMQAVGLVNDHVTDCYRYREVRRLARI